MGRSGKVVSHIVGLLIVTNVGDPKVVLHGTDLVIRIKGLLTLREYRRIGIMKVPKLRTALSLFIVVALIGIDSDLGQVLQRCEG